MAKAWVENGKEIVRKMAKENKTLAEVMHYFPGIKPMKIILLARSISYLGNVETQNKEDCKHRQDNTLTKREAFPDSNLRWEDGDNIRLKRMLFEQKNINDICSELKRTYNAVALQLEKLYPTKNVQEELFREMTKYIRIRPLSKIGNNNQGE